VPIVALPPAIPFTDQVKVFPAREGTNVCIDPARTDALLGESIRVSEGEDSDVGGV
jgi:hypothetical protein